MGSRELNLVTLQHFHQRNGESLSIFQEIGVKNQEFGTLLLQDKTGQTISAIAKEHRGNATDINREILQRWLQGQGKQPISWNTLVLTLRDVQLSVLADKIQREVGEMGLQERNAPIPQQTHIPNPPDSHSDSSFTPNQSHDNQQMDYSTAMTFDQLYHWLKSNQVPSADCEKIKAKEIGGILFPHVKGEMWKEFEISTAGIMILGLLQDKIQGKKPEALATGRLSMDGPDDDAGGVLASINDKTLNTDDHAEVLDSIESLSSSWRLFSTKLGLKHSALERIESDYQGVMMRLSQALVEWLKLNYDHDRHGKPSWRRLAKAVKPLDYALFEKIANEHQSRTASAAMQQPAKQLLKEPTARYKDVPLELKSLTPLLKSVIPKYMQLALALGLKTSTVATIEMNHPKQAQRVLIEILDRWLANSRKSDLSWVVLANALLEIDEKELAYTIAK